MTDRANDTRGRPRPGAAGRQASTGKIWVVTALLSAPLLLVGADRVLDLPENHDLSWLLYVAGEVLGGAELYVDLIEVNPPLVMFVMVGIRAAADAIGVYDLMLYRLLLLLLTVGSILLCAFILARMLEPRQRWAILYFCLASLFLLVPWPGYEFGQREHATLILILPYLALAAARAMGVRSPVSPATAAVIGIAAAVGLAMKPYFLGVWAAILVYLLIRSSRQAWRWPEQLACGVTFAAYGAAVLIFAPAYLRVASWATQVYAGFHPAPPSHIATSPPALFAAFVVLAALAAPAPPPVARIKEVLSIATLMFLVAILVQGKGWDYHWLTVTITAPLLALMTLIGLLQKLPRASRLPVGSLLVAPLVAGLLFVLMFRVTDGRRATSERMAEWPYYLPQLHDLVQKYAPNGTISSFTTTLQSTFPLVRYADIEWGSRFNSMWLLPGLYRGASSRDAEFPYRPLDERTPLERYLFDAVVSDLRAHRPDLLIVDTSPPRYDMLGFDYVEYFGRDPRFRRLFAAYEPLASIGPYVILMRLASADS